MSLSARRCAKHAEYRDTLATIEEGVGMATALTGDLDFSGFETPLLFDGFVVYEPQPTVRAYIGKNRERLCLGRGIVDVMGRPEYVTIWVHEATNKIALRPLPPGMKPGKLNRGELVRKLSLLPSGDATLNHAKLWSGRGFLAGQRFDVQCSAAGAILTPNQEFQRFRADRSR